MSNKKKSKPKKKNLIQGRLDEMEAINGAAHRVNSVIQKMTEPPETVMAHLKRIGIQPIIDQMMLDNGEPKTYVLFEYEELLKKELDNIANGSSFKDTYPPVGEMVAPLKAPTAPVILDEIRKRMEESVKRHPSYLNQQEDNQMTLDDVDDDVDVDDDDDDDDWPISGENPSL